MKIMILMSLHCHRVKWDYTLFVKSFLIVMPYYCYYACSLNWDGVWHLHADSGWFQADVVNWKHAFIFLPEKLYDFNVFFSCIPNYLFSWWQLLCQFAWWFVDDENRFWIRFYPAWSNWYSIEKMMIILYLILKVYFCQSHILVRI